eukprot:m.306072 g.306072  ORF g.306072 m.306072 type:complete len:84 (+) comp40940_c0_seq1:147-398(+)
MSQWKNGVFSCFDSGEICVFTWFFPCYWTTKMRQYVEREKGIEQPSFMMDCLLTTFCGSCTAQQQVRELGAYTAPGGESMARE